MPLSLLNRSLAARQNSGAITALVVKVSFLSSPISMPLERFACEFDQKVDTKSCLNGLAFRVRWLPLLNTPVSHDALQV
jgi:hypothetical protein